MSIYGNGTQPSNNDPTQENPLFVDGIPYTTSSYNAPDFESSGASITSSTVYLIDTNSNGLYDFLTVNVSVTVSTSGTYGLSGRLTTATGEFIMDANGYGTLASPGNIQLDFGGEKIREKGLDGPYNISYTLQTILNETLIARGSYQTNSYNYTQFELSRLTYFNINYSEYGLDTDNNTLYNFLVVDMNISTNTNSTYEVYDIYVILDSRNGTYISRTNTTQTLNNATKNIQVNISGADIWRARISNTTYNISIEVYRNSSNYTLITSLENRYSTRAYRYNEFQMSSAGFVSNYTDSGVDLDDDTFYDYLKVIARVNVTANGSYTLYGYLYDGNGSYIVSAKNDTNLTGGLRDIQVYFDGIEIYSHRVNGPYVLKYVNLYDQSGNQLDYETDPHTTRDYNYTSFERYFVEFTENYSDRGVDVNNDSMYDALVVTVGVVAENNGTYGINARLVDSNNREIKWASNTSALNASQSRTMTLIFDGKTIYGNGVNGPYYLRDVHVYNTEYSEQYNSVHDAYTTSAYNYTNFQIAGVIQGYVKDVNGTPIPNSIVSHSGDSDTSNASGYYRLTIPSNGNYSITAASPYGTDYLANTTTVRATIGNTTELNITLQHEGIISGKILYINGTPVYNAHIVLGLGPTSGSNYSNASGDFMIKGLAAGNYNVSVTPPSGVNLLWTYNITVVNHGETTNINITMRTGGILTGYVTDPSGIPIYSHYVSVSGGPSSGSDYTDSLGLYEIVALDTGTYNVTADSVYSQNLRSNKTQVNVTAGEITYRNLTLPQLTDMYINSNTILNGGTLSLDDPDTDGAIIINTSNVFLDCNNSVINGTGVGYGIYSYTYVNVTIRNCTILNYSRGIYIRSSSSRNVLENNRVSFSYYGIYYYYSNNDTISNNTLNYNNYGIYLSDSQNNNLNQNTVRSNSDIGIYAYYSDNNRLERNEIKNQSGTSDTGIYLYSSNGNYLSRNILDNNTYGIRLYYSENSFILNNTVKLSQYGIYITGSANNTLYHNNLINSTTPAYDTLNNTWDMGSVIGGNYWSGHNCTGNPSNGNQPRNISGGSGAIDHYPFNKSFGWVTDTEKPSVSSITVIPTRTVAGIPVTISANVDDLEIASVTARVTLPNGTTETVTLRETSPTYRNYFSGTNRIGNYSVTIVANDTSGNANDTGSASFEIVDNITQTTVTNTTNGTPATIDASSGDTVVQITTTGNVSNANVTITLSSNTSVGSMFNAPGLDKYVSITVSPEITNALSSAVIRIYYTDAELEVAGISESELSIYRYNSTLNEWQKLDSSTMSWVLDTGVNTASNYVWAEVTKFSTFVVGRNTTYETSNMTFKQGWNLISVPLEPI